MLPAPSPTETNDSSHGRAATRDTRESLTGFFPCVKPRTPAQTRPAPLPTAPSSPAVSGIGTRFPVPFGGTALNEATPALTTRTRFRTRFTAPSSAGPDGASPAASMLRGRRGPARGAGSEVRGAGREERRERGSAERGAGGAGAPGRRARRGGGGGEPGGGRGGGAAAPRGRAAGRRWLLGVPRPPPPRRRREPPAMLRGGRSPLPPPAGPPGGARGQAGAPGAAQVAAGSLLALLILWTLFGNVLVCAAIVRYRHLRSKVTNIFIVSLAVSDLLVAVLVMPWKAVAEVAGYWPFGAFCNVWVAFDIMCSTASILNLCVISVDRYWAISSPFRYERKMTQRLALVMIGVAWALSVLISFIPVQLNWPRGGDAATAAECCPTCPSSPLCCLLCRKKWGNLLENWLLLVTSARHEYSM